MGIRNIPLVSSEYYHVYNRGNGKNQIFFDDEDYKRFIKLLFVCNSDRKFNFRDDLIEKNIDALDFERGNQLVYIGAWVLMPNHFHLYITPKPNARRLAGNSVTYFMHRVLTAYSKYFNARYKRTGSLFEGKFKSIHVNKDTQAKYLFSYIHLNPLKLVDSNWNKNRSKASILKFIIFLDSYKWSSYLDYMEIIRSENKILDRIDFIDYFETKKSFQKEIFEWIKIKIEEEN